MFINFTVKISSPQSQDMMLEKIEAISEMITNKNTRAMARFSDKPMMMLYNKKGFELQKTKKNHNADAYKLKCKFVSEAPTTLKIYAKSSLTEPISLIVLSFMIIISYLTSLFFIFFALLLFMIKLKSTKKGKIEARKLIEMVKEAVNGEFE